jgi:hypothetical protein
MVMKVALPFVMLLAAIGALAESTDCLNPSLVQADDRLVTSHFAGRSGSSTPTYWYAIYGLAGHSYSAEFVATPDNESVSTSIYFNNLYVWGPSDISSLQQNSCAGPSSVAYYATQGYAPAVAKSKYGVGQRISFTAATTGLYIFSVTNYQAAGTYSYRFTDTTLFCARWSTLSGGDSHWSFTNLSDMPITGTLNVYESSGRLVVAAPVVLPAGGHSSHYTASSDLNLNRNLAGYAVFSHNGPPQAVLADAYLVTTTGLVFVKFESRSQQ